MGTSKSNFGATKDGSTVDLYTLTNANGMEVKIMNYGGIIVSVKVPDKNGQFADVVLGFDSLKDYEEKSPLLRLHYRPVCQPYCQRKIHP